RPRKRLGTRRVAHQGLTRVPARTAAFFQRSFLFLAASLTPFLGLGCGTTPRVTAPTLPLGEEGRGPGSLSLESRTLLRYHSPRFKVSVPLPDGRTWRIDDHSKGE